MEQKIAPLEDWNLIDAYLESRWRAFVHGEGTGDCQTCKGCCRAGYVIGLSKEEAEWIPHTTVGEHAVVMPLADGRCPMLDETDSCSIYERRPVSCRQFDCRDFAMAGIKLVERNAGEAEINASVDRHLANHGMRIILPYHKQAELLIAAGKDATTTVQQGLVLGMMQRMGEEKFAPVAAALMSDAETERDAAAAAGGALLGKPA